MSHGPIENLVGGSPYFEPGQHVGTFADATFADEVGPPTRRQPNEIVAEIRQAIGRWRAQGHSGSMPATREPRALAIRAHLGCLRGRPVAGRELLTESGLVFVQIRDADLPLVPGTTIPSVRRVDDHPVARIALWDDTVAGS